MATSTRLPAFTRPSTVRAAVIKPPRRDRAYEMARMIGMMTICLLTGTSLHFLNLI
jgi:hypothetical protein